MGNKKTKMADERDPAERVRRLVQYAGQVEVDNSIEPKKYFRSGVEMERMVRIICQVMGCEMDCIDVCCNNFFLSTVTSWRTLWLLLFYHAS